MARVNTLIFPFTFQGQPLPLMGAAFMEMVVSITRLSPNGQGWRTLQASESLQPGGTYIVFSAQVPYDIPEVIAGVMPAPSNFVYSQDIATAPIYNPVAT